MAIDTQFHTPARSLTVGDAASISAVHSDDELDSERLIETLASAVSPSVDSLVFVDGPGNLELDQLAKCAAVLCRPETAGKLPEGPAALITDSPRAAFQDLALALFPESLGDARPFADPAQAKQHPSGALVSHTAQLEDNVLLQPGAMIGDGVQIGAGSSIGANTIIAHQCRIGRQAQIGPNCSIQYALIGDRMTLSAGAMIGQDGFGFVPRSTGLKRMPQLGRVIIQDDVEIGAGTAIDRGTLGDTVIGQGTKVDNLVQIAHNVRIGLHTVIAGLCGIAGSVTIGSQCMLGGGVGIADQLTIGDGVQIAGRSGVMTDIPAGERWGGSPAQPIKQAMRELAALRRLANDRKSAR